VFELVQRSLRLPSGLRQDVDCILHGGAVAIAARDDEDRMLVVRQYRAALDDWLLEIPAGRLEQDERPLVAAKRELEEETGQRAAKWQLLRRMIPAPGFCSEVIHIFEARELETIEGGGLLCDDDEELEVTWVPRAELLAGATDDAKTLLACLLLESS